MVADGFPFASLVSVTVRETVSVARVGEAVPEGNTVPDGDMLAEMHWLGVKEVSRREAKGVGDPVLERVRVVLEERVPTREELGAGVKEGDRVVEMLEEEEAQLEGVGVAPELLLRLGLAEGVGVRVMEALAVGQKLPVRLPPRVFDTVPLAVPEALDCREALTLSVPDKEELSEVLGVVLADRVLEFVGRAEAEEDRVEVTVGVCDRLMVAVTE